MARPLFAEEFEERFFGRKREEEQEPALPEPIREINLPAPVREREEFLDPFRYLREKMESAPTLEEGISAARELGRALGEAHVAARRAQIEQDELDRARAIARELELERWPAREESLPTKSPPVQAPPAQVSRSLLEDLLVEAGGTGVQPASRTGVQPASPPSAEFVRTQEVLRGMEDIFADPATRLLETFAKERFLGLLQPPFTEAEEARRRAQAFEQIEFARKAAKDRVLEKMAALGHGPASGTVALALQKVDETFDRLITEAERSLLLEGIGERQTRLREALAVASLLPELQSERLRLASGVLSGVTPQPSEIFAQLSNLAAMRQRASEIAAAQQGSFLNALGQIIGVVLANPTILKGLGF